MQILDPYAVAPKDMQELISLHAFLEFSGLDELLIELLRLHVSRLNGCTPGIVRHARRVSALGGNEKLAALGGWQSHSLLTQRERAALEWCEAVTLMPQTRVPDPLHAEIRQWFTDIEIVQLTVIIAATIAWNSVEMTFSRAQNEAEESQ